MPCRGERPRVCPPMRCLKAWQAQGLQSRLPLPHALRLATPTVIRPDRPRSRRDRRPPPSWFWPVAAHTPPCSPLGRPGARHGPVPVIGRPRVAPGRGDRLQSRVWLPALTEPCGGTALAPPRGLAAPPGVAAPSKALGRPRGPPPAGAIGEQPTPPDAHEVLAQGAWGPTAWAAAVAALRAAPGGTADCAERQAPLLAVGHSQERPRGLSSSGPLLLSNTTAESKGGQSVEPLRKHFRILRTSNSLLLPQNERAMLL